MSRKQILFFILFFCLNPFIGTLSLLIVKMIVNKRDIYSDFLVFFFLMSFAILLQCTHIWDPSKPSDWYNDGYWGLFNQAKNYSFIGYLFDYQTPRESLWLAINYIGYYLTGGNYHLFINFIAILTFFIYAYSIYLYWKYIGAQSIVLISMLVFSLFFIEFWDQVNNLIRQFFATSIIIYVYVKKITSNKINWWLLFSAGLIHTLCFIYVPLLLFKPFSSKIKIKQLFYLLLAVLIVIVALNQISFLKMIFTGIDFLAYGLTRLENADNPNDTNFLNPTSVYITTIIVICVCIFMNYTNNKDKKTYFFTNILMVLMILSAGILNLMPEIAGRIYTARFYFWSFVLPLFMAKYKSINTIYAWGIIIFFFTRFLISFDGIRGGGFYPPIADLLPRTLIQYLI